MGMCQVAGIQHGTSKKGNDFRILHLMEPFGDPKYGEGCRVNSEFINNDVDLKNIKPGMHVRLEYNKGFDGRAYVSGVYPVSEPGKSK